MRTLMLALGALMSLAACSDPDPAADAERELAMIEKAHGSADEICAAANKVAKAHLEALNQAGYSAARSAARIKCQSAQLDENQGVQPDDLAPR